MGEVVLVFLPNNFSFQVIKDFVDRHGIQKASERFAFINFLPELPNAHKYILYYLLRLKTVFQVGVSEVIQIFAVCHKNRLKGQHIATFQTSNYLLINMFYRTCQVKLACCFVLG